MTRATAPVPPSPATSARVAAAKPGSSTGRVHNFSAGPGCMPEEVLRQIQDEVWDCRNSGVGILEHSHRAGVFDAILAEAEQDCRDVGNIPANYRVLFMTGGSTAQNFMIPMNLMPADRSGTADYFCTGHWAQNSIEHARIFGTVHECASSKSGGAANHSYIPSAAETKYSAKPAYVHYTSNNTIFGTQFAYVPTPPAGSGGVPLVCDMCSDIFSKPIDVTKYALIYASAQKNLGPAGVTVVIVRDDIVDRGRSDIPVMLQYRTFAKEQSRPNTPPVFPIYAVGLMLKWIKKSGGVKHFEKFNAEKAKRIYDLLDASAGGFYKSHARKDSRSLMNVTFRCPTPALDDQFVAEAEKAGLDCLKGHRATGGMRASMYNAMPREGCEALARFMAEFERKNG